MFTMHCSVLLHVIVWEPRYKWQLKKRITRSLDLLDSVGWSDMEQGADGSLSAQREAVLETLVDAWSAMDHAEDGAVTAHAERRKRDAKEAKLKAEQKAEEKRRQEQARAKRASKRGG